MFAITFPSPQFSTGFHPFSRFNCLVPSRVTSPTPLPLLADDSTSKKRLCTYVRVHFRSDSRASSEKTRVLGRARADVSISHDPGGSNRNVEKVFNLRRIDRQQSNNNCPEPIDDSSSLAELRETIFHLSLLATNLHSNFLAKQIPVNKTDLVRGAVPLILKTQFIPR